METPNYRKASIYFDDETVLEVTQRGGGGSGVGGETGLEAVNLITGESTNAALAAKDETIAEQAETIETQAGTIEEQAATIETQAATIIEKDETIATQAATITEQAGTIEELETQLASAPGTLNRTLSYEIYNTAGSPDVGKIVNIATSCSQLSGGTCYASYLKTFLDNSSRLDVHIFQPLYLRGALTAAGSSVATFVIPDDATIVFDSSYNTTGVSMLNPLTVSGYKVYNIIFTDSVPENSHTRVRITAAAAA